MQQQCYEKCMNLFSRQDAEVSFVIQHWRDENDIQKEEAAAFKISCRSEWHSVTGDEPFSAAYTDIEMCVTLVFSV